jgi:entericidin B
MKKLIAVFTLATYAAVMFASGMLAGCNTVEGAGKDIERGGEKLQGSARDAKQKM